MNFTGRVAIVTGAAGGIGAATARLFAAKGAAVLMADVKPEVAARAQEWRAEGFPVAAYVGDAATETGAEAIVSAALASFGRVDIVHANAGVSGPLAPRLDTGAAEFAETLRINLIGPWLLIRAALPHLRPGAAIVCTASVAGLRAGAGGIPYSASKAGVINLVLTLAQALAGRGIRINAVAPGLIETPMTAPLFEDARARGREGKIGQLNPLRRAGRAEEVAEAVAWLASDAASYVNGAVLTVDGGFSAQHPFSPRWSSVSES